MPISGELLEFPANCFRKLAEPVPLEPPEPLGIVSVDVERVLRPMIGVREIGTPDVLQRLNAAAVALDRSMARPLNQEVGEQDKRMECGFASGGSFASDCEFLFGTLRGFGAADSDLNEGSDFLDPLLDGQRPFQCSCHPSIFIPAAHLEGSGCM